VPSLLRADGETLTTPPLKVCRSSAVAVSLPRRPAQVPAALGDASEPTAALAGGAACLAACLGYCGYQVAVPELQRRKIAAAHRKRRAPPPYPTLTLYPLCRALSWCQKASLAPCCVAGLGCSCARLCHSTLRRAGLAS
jgi:hypothetical protein